ncbi:MAG: bifunctional uridylyltransferase/uridylyl-removing protein GlnD [Desulfovibrio aminophilus]|uniref:bifunctional uridylyltransferase/uridylyl-removing protein GlnD n=1 Tax=Desulfovibrio aminophilus TaxID=81425 RepID=UPI0039E899BD
MGRDAEAPSPAAAALGVERSALLNEARAGNLDGFPARLSAAVDRYFRARFAELAGTLPAAPFCLLAVGGYGRSELCPHSDIDCLVLFSGSVPRRALELVRALFHPLWNLGLDLGQGVRSLADCLSLARSEPQILASLLDARAVAGDPAPAEKLMAGLASRVAPRRALGFARWLAEQNALREAQYGDGSGLLEPDLKNGLGGLRGRHHIRWLERILELGGKPLDLFTGEERAELDQHGMFLLRARTALHLAAGRRLDTLTFEHQPRVAEALGFGGPSRALAVEAFLSRLHRCMAGIKTMRQACWRACCAGPRRLARPDDPRLIDSPAGLDFRDPGQLSSDPDAALAIFLASARSRRPVSWPALRVIRAALPGLSAALSGRPGILRTMLELFLADREPGQGPVQVLAETGLLSALIPEFGRAEHLVQFDDYHLHPLGRHTLECVRVLARFLRPGAGGEPPGGCRWCGEAAGRLDDATALLLAGLCHDLGKPLPGDHSERGEEICREVAARFGGAPEIAEDAAFLVRRHLFLPIAATRRDLSDENVVSQAAEVVGTARRLDMLALLSVADGLATGPRAWNNWTAALMAELFFKVRKLLTEGPLSEPDAARKIVEKRDRVRALAVGRFSSEVVERGLDAMPVRALHVLDAETLLEHLELAGELEEAVAEDRRRKPGDKGGIGVCLVRARPTAVPGYWELTVAALDRPGLFATLAGVLSLHGLDIRSAELLTWKGGAALDTFVVSEPPDNLFPEEAWGRVQRSAHYALTGKLDLEYRLEERRRSPLSVSAARPRYRPSVSVDNDESDFLTRVEVKAGDRLGLLHDVALALHRLGLDIQSARIASSGGRVADVFYVRDGLGLKLTDPGPAREAERVLLEAARGEGGKIDGAIEP